MTRPRLLIIVGSTRPGRIGLPVAQWFRREAEELGAFDIEFADLLEENLPLLDEPHHPRLGKYEHEHTKRWSAKVAAADAIAFVMPEYNFSFNAALKNALDYLFAEWRHKPCILVSYGGVSAGTRAAAALRAPLASVGAYVMPTAVAIPFVRGFLKDDVIEPNEMMHEAAQAALTEAEQFAEATAGLRTKGQ